MLKGVGGREGGSRGTEREGGRREGEKGREGKGERRESVHQSKGYDIRAHPQKDKDEDKEDEEEVEGGEEKEEEREEDNDFPFCLSQCLSISRSQFLFYSILLTIEHLILSSVHEVTLVVAVVFILNKIMHFCVIKYF